MIYDRAQNTEKSVIFVPNIDVTEIARVFLFVFFFVFVVVVFYLFVSFLFFN